MNFDEEDLTDEDLDFEELTEAEVQAKIPEFDSVKLCDIIVSFRYLGLYKFLYVLAMEELAKRRIDGDPFDFEKYIEESTKELPKLEFNITDVNLAMEQLRKMTDYCNKCIK